jgi:hypothetical protein
MDPRVQLDQEFADKRRGLEGALVAKHAELTSIDTAFTCEWGVGEGSEQVRYNRDKYNIAVIPYNQKRLVILNEITWLRGEIEYLPMELHTRRQTLSAATVYGPDIRVAALDLPEWADEPNAIAMERQRAADVTERQDASDRLAYTADRLREKQEKYDEVARDRKHGLATDAQVRAAELDAQAAARVVEQTRERIETLDAKVHSTDQRLASLRAEFDARRRRLIEKAIDTAMHAAADATVAAMSAMTLLHRALQLDPPPLDDLTPLYAMKALDADTRASAGRQFLQRCLEHGWTLKKSR